MGRKAYRVLTRQPGCRNIDRYEGPAFLRSGREESVVRPIGKQLLLLLFHGFGSITIVGRVKGSKTIRGKIAMKRKLLFFCSMSLLMAGPSFALEFQQMGKFGMGGAGVARTFDATAAYWNPGALAFDEEKTAINFSGSAGYRIDDNLAGNVDRLSRLEDPTTGDLDLTADTATNLARAGQAVQLIGVMAEIKQAGNNSLQMNGDAVLAVRYNHFATGIFGTLQGAGTPDLDLTNIRLTGIGSAAELATAIGATSSGAPVFFTQEQFQQISNAFGGGTIGDNIAFAFDRQFSTSNITNLSAASALNALILLGNSISDASITGTIDTNQSTLETRGLAFFEVPLAYGYPINLGRFGTLGIGGAVKVMSGRVYLSKTTLFTTTSGDIFGDITRHHKDSVTWGVDLGALWKWHNINVGIVAKNLNSPEFSTSGLESSVDGFTIKPQVRGGVSVGLLSWLSLAADIDITKNETTQPGVKSQNIGGGLEFTPIDWFSFRMGAYKNIEASNFGPIVTAGLTLGTTWLNVDLGAAVSPETAEYQGSSYPREAKVHLSLNSKF